MSYDEINLLVKLRYALGDNGRRMQPELVEYAAAMKKLADFGAWCAREFRASLGDVDGGSAQEAMERFGVLAKRTVTRPCGEGCVCVEYGDFPHECFVFPGDVRDAMGE